MAHNGIKEVSESEFRNTPEKHYHPAALSRDFSFFIIIIFFNDFEIVALSKITLSAIASIIFHI